MQSFKEQQRDKKAFLSDQCKEIEESNRMEISRDLFKKVGDTKGTFHAKMGTIKDRNCMDLTEAEDIKKRSTENSVVHRIHRKTIQKRSSRPSPRARQPGMCSQVGLRKHHYEQS